MARLELVRTLRPLDLSLEQIRTLVETMDAAVTTADPDGRAEAADRGHW